MLLHRWKLGCLSSESFPFELRTPIVKGFHLNYVRERNGLCVKMWSFTFLAEWPSLCHGSLKDRMNFWNYEHGCLAKEKRKNKRNLVAQACNYFFLSFSRTTLIKIAWDHDVWMHRIDCLYAWQMFFERMNFHCGIAFK